MKFKLLSIAFLTLFTCLPLSQAQFISLDRSPTFPISQTVTLSKPSPLTIIWTGYIDANPSFSVLLRIDGITVDSNLVSGTAGRVFQSRTYRSDVITSGTHTVNVQVIGDDFASDGSLLTIAEVEEIAGLQDAITELTSAYQNADAEIQSSLLQQMAAIEEAMQIQLYDLQRRVFDSEGDSLANTVATLQYQIEDLQQQIATLLETPPGEGSQSTLNFTSFHNTLVNQQVSINQANRYSSSITQIDTSSGSGLKATDYAIMGGSTVAATAIGIGIYSLVDDDEASQEDKREMPPKNNNRPGYGK